MIWLPFRKSPFEHPVRIAHRLPGRLRLRIPALAGSKNGFKEYAPAVEKLLAGLPGVSSASINPVTASVLLMYDDATITDTTLMNWIEQLATDGILKYQKMNSSTNVHLRLSKIREQLEDEIESIRADHAATI